MVFLSTLQAMVGGPLIRSVFAFGTRPLTQRIIVEEMIMGMFLTFPISAWISFLTIRLACYGKRSSGDNINDNVNDNNTNNNSVTKASHKTKGASSASSKQQKQQSQKQQDQNQSSSSSSSTSLFSWFRRDGFCMVVIRSDLWTTLLITLVGDIFLEILLPSLQCLPVHPVLHRLPPEAAAPYYYSEHSFFLEDNLPSFSESYFHWLAQTWGFLCPAPETLSRSQLLSTDAVGTLLTLRLLFMCLGIYIGESCVPIALTGGIATGKSTVAKLLAQETAASSMAATQQHNKGSSSKGGGGKQGSSGYSLFLDTPTAAAHSQTPSSRSSKKKSRQQQQQQRSTHNSFDLGGPHASPLLHSSIHESPNLQAASMAAVAGISGGAGASSSSSSACILSNPHDPFHGSTGGGSGGGGDQEEGSFLIIDSDRIAHEILLPPSVLAGYSTAEVPPLLNQYSSSFLQQEEYASAHYHNNPYLSSAAAAAARSYLVPPQHSVYYQILHVFECDDDDNNENEENGEGGDEKSDDNDEGDPNQELIMEEDKTLGGEANEITPTKKNENSQAQKYVSIADSKEDLSSSILDENGLIDRLKLGAKVFKHPHLRRKLNRITHPRIFFVLIQQIFRGIFCSAKDIVCADIPLLFESGPLRWMFAITICVACDPHIQFKRLRQRNPELSEEQCWDRIKSQMPLDEKVKRADIVIWNNGDLEHLAEQVERARSDVMGRMYGIGMSLLQMLLLVGGSLSLAVSSKLYSSWS